eukprot:COSAG01_NODE_44347_length_420_cov_0.641745_2_plen_27_part_01
MAITHASSSSGKQEFEPTAARPFIDMH